VSLIGEDIKENRERADCVVVSLHWGEEFCHYPTPGQMSVARGIIDAGAHIVLGHHSHVLQGIERYRKGVIAYNLGSLMMSGPSGNYRYELQENNRQSAILRFTISTGGSREMEIIPTRLNEDLRPVICEGAHRDTILKRIDGLSRLVVTDDYPEFWRKIELEKKISGPFREWVARGNYLKRMKNLRPRDIRRPYDFITSCLKIVLQKN
jgi:poly-gamma-glutamate synthesis protein (capsule biosynthesis protein)